MADDEHHARRQQAKLGEERAASRIEEAQLERDAIRRAQEAVASGDPLAVAEAAAELHRVHAMHEARAGHENRSAASLRRAARATQRLLVLRRR